MNHNLQFASLTMERHFWMSMHNMSAIIFSLSAVAHIAMNWRSLTHYAKRLNGMLVSKEAIAATAVVLGIVCLFASHAFLVP
jgi:hypothetical protein